VLKVARAGRLIWEQVFNDLEAIAKHLKCSMDIVNQIVKGQRFPKGKTCVFNKYIIRQEVKSDAPTTNPFVITFD